MVKMSILSSTCNNQTLVDVKEWMTSLLDCTSGDYELIVVDNGSSEEIEQYLQSIKLPNYCLIRNPINVGLGVSTDQAYYVAKGDIIFRVDSDVVFYTYRWNQFMLEWLKAFSEIAQIGTPANTGEFVGSKKGFAEVKKVMGCCQAIPRDAFMQVERFLLENRDRIVLYIDNLVQSPKLTKEQKRRIYLVKSWVLTGKGSWDGLGYWYGVDDFCQSLLFRYIGLSLAVASEVNILHKSTSEKPELREVRHKNVAEGFSYFRTKWDILYNVLGDRDGIIMDTMKPIFSNFEGRDFQ